jgi:predicted RNase H-like HicB family nuclease
MTAFLSEPDERVCGFLIERSERTPAGQFFATSPELPGLIVADSTREQLEAKIPDAIGALLRAYVNRSPPEKVTAAETYHMTPGEQRIMNKALRRSTHPTLCEHNWIGGNDGSWCPLCKEERTQHAAPNDLSDAAKAWYTRIAPQPTVHGRIQELAAILAEGRPRNPKEESK